MWRSLVPAFIVESNLKRKAFTRVYAKVEREKERLRALNFGRFQMLRVALARVRACRGVAWQLECAMAAQGRGIAGLGFASPSRVLRGADDKDIDDLGIATGLEREELEFAKAGKKRWDEPPVGPFGTAEKPAIIESWYDERIVGCPGGPGDDEHDVIWFKLKKNERHECSICGQIFELKCIGPGGPPGGHHGSHH
ncbi:cytochrome c oxidase subunit 5b-2, mitochondrial [Selaginella moellendorffii]|uniref:cytochrome c oxidase subunit 5b-2, mitochondrial n=1 Tax=Selaginella moellendorffii TaxID=88036 RepID=UPI000D1CCCA9|nr:cytochrome c oxidase subunit 5b-2, mitochondrial [Selaginella moellendorffii]|eukprot:XP_002984710.2 cytochrome c oxidase subunit 5b-2, mitochondrial [Selaginella moellendorffii]